MVAAFVGLREFGYARGRCFVPFVECDLEKLLMLAK
jgi:hypothetical protein